jgi:putative sigma-54 modulation protein
MVSDETRSKITTKLEKLTRLFDRLTEVEMTIDLEHRESPNVDLRVSAEHKHDFVATHQSDDLMGSIDQVIHKLEQQLRRYKEKIQTRSRNAAGREEGVAPGPEPADL